MMLNNQMRETEMKIRKVQLEIVLESNDITSMEKEEKVIASFDRGGYRYWLSGRIKTKDYLGKPEPKERTAAQKLVLERLKQVPKDARLCNI